MSSKKSGSVLLLRLEFEHDVAVHLDQPAVAVPGEVLVARLLDEGGHRRLVETDVEHRVHHAGHRLAGTRPAGEQQRILAVAELRAHHLFGVLDAGFNLRLEFRRIAPVVGVEVPANVGRERETGGDRQADEVHLGEVGPLAPQFVLHAGRAVRLAAPELEHILLLRHRLRFPDWFAVSDRSAVHSCRITSQASDL